MEYVPPKVIIDALLKFEGLLLSIKRHYVDIITIRDGQVTKCWFFGMPFILVIMWYLSIPDSFVLWVMLNYTILRNRIRKFI